MSNILSLTPPYSTMVQKLDKEIQELTSLKSQIISEFMNKNGIPPNQEWTIVGDGTGLINVKGFECRKPHLEPPVLKPDSKKEGKE